MMQDLLRCTIDLKDVFLSILISLPFQCFLAFVEDRVVYIFTHLPFGLAVAHWAFTQVIHPIKGISHHQGLILHSPLDDFILFTFTQGGLRSDTFYQEVLPDSFSVLGVPRVQFYLDSCTLYLLIPEVLSIRHLYQLCLSLFSLSR